MTDFTLGVEEEFHLVDARSLDLRPDAGEVVQQAREQLGDDVDRELLRSQVETGTAVCSTLADVRAELVRLRRQVAASAAGLGCRIVASGTYPGRSPVTAITRDERYEAMAEMFRTTAREQVSCGCHVHVAIADRELAIAVLRRSRPWLPVLLALSANSPLWHGEDTGYASYRSEVWGRWPTAGAPAAFGCRAEYDDAVDRLLATGVLRDRGMLYWAVRASHRYETLEFRFADVCLGVDDAVLVAALTRALAHECARAEEAGQPAEDVRPEVLRAMLWRASRFGTDGELVDPDTGRPAPAGEVVRRLLDQVRPALEEYGEAAEVSALTEALLARGTGAARQRAVYERRRQVHDVLDMLVRETAPTG